MNKQEVGYKKAMPCLLLGLSSKYHSSLVSLTKVYDTWQAELCKQKSCGLQLSKVSACLRSWARAGMHGAAQSGWEMERKRGAA